MVVKELAVRLKRGTDLKRSIEGLCIEKGINTAIVLSAVGCVYEARFRLAKGESFYESKRDYEIVSMTGTVSKGKAHIHVSFSDDTGKTIGGHLSEGCLVNSTCELVLGILEEYVSYREDDPDTGYDEINFVERR